MKKLMAMAMAVVLMLMLAGCGQKEPKEFDWYCATQYVIDVFGSDLEAFERKLEAAGVAFEYREEMDGYVHYSEDNNMVEDILYHRR